MLYYLKLSASTSIYSICAYKILLSLKDLEGFCSSYWSQIIWMLILYIFPFWISKLDVEEVSSRIVLLDFNKALTESTWMYWLLNRLTRVFVDLLSHEYVTFKLIASRESILGNQFWCRAQVNTIVAQGTKLGPILFLVTVSEYNTVRKIEVRWWSCHLRSCTEIQKWIHELDHATWRS